METGEIIRLCRSIIELTHLGTLKSNLRKDKPYLKIPYYDVGKFNLHLADELLNNPEETIKAFELAIDQLDLDYSGQIKVMVTGLPETSNIPIWVIREQLKKFIKVEGYVAKPDSILLRPEKETYECPSCGHTLTCIAMDRLTKIKTPEKCVCGRKGKMRLIERETVSTRRIFIEEDIMELEERQIPRSKLVILEGTLTDTEVDKKIQAGKRIVINGWLETYEVSAKTGMLDTYLFANSIEFVERGWAIIKTSKKEREDFHKIAESKLLIKDLSQSILPTIYGEEPVKHALLLQLAGSQNIYDDKKFLEERGCIHIALIGSPGSGKTYSSRRMSKFWPIYRFTSAVTSTGRGLIGANVYDKILEKWVLIAGVIPSCHLGMCVIDELEKMEKAEYGYLNNSMNDLTVTITKVAQGKLNTDTAILATMNPRGRVYLDGVPVYEQIDLPADLIDRFDLIFSVVASAVEEDQRKIFKIGLAKRNKSKEVKPIMEEEDVLKYFSYARTFDPIIPPELEKEVEDRVMKFVKPSQADQQISNRVFWVILRLLHASARLHLRSKVTEGDINEVMALLIDSYKSQGLLDSHNLLDYARAEHIDEVIANAVPLVKETIKKLEENFKPVPLEDVVEELKGKVTEDKLEEAIQKLKNVGDLFEPRHGFVQLV